MGAIQALQLNIPGEPVLKGALADGLLINVTQENVLRFLPPFLLQEKHVDAGVRILKRQLAAAQKAARANEDAGRSDGVQNALFRRLPGLVGRGTVDLWHLATRDARVDGELPAMMNVIEQQVEKHR